MPARKPTPAPPAEESPAGGFRAKIKDVKTIKGIIDAVSAIIDETNFVADKTGLKILAIDESHICLASMEFPAGFWDEFACDEPVKMGLSLEDLGKIAKRASASDAIELNHAPDSGKIQVQMKGKGTRTFSLRLVDIDPDKIPPTADLDVEFDAKIGIDPAVIAEAIKDAEIYQDTLEVTINAENIKFAAEGEVGDMAYVLDKDHLETFELKAGEDGVTLTARGVFSLAFLKNIMKANDVAEKLIISVADNAPLKFEFTIPGKDPAEGADRVDGHIIYYLAPRVEED